MQTFSLKLNKIKKCGKKVERFKIFKYRLCTVYTNKAKFYKNLNSRILQYKNFGQ
ncbi:MAG: hypothetical protein RL172_254 [Bacteroidota bacterium]|jgi:hypothetical protein